MNNLFKAAAFAVSTLAVPMSAHAVTLDPVRPIGNTVGPVITGPQTGWGASVSANTFANCPSFCTGAGAVFTSDGGEGETSAFSSEQTSGDARALVQFNGPTVLPTLKAIGSAGAGKQATARAFAIQGYTYDGSDVLDALFDYTLTGNASVNGSNSAATIRASLAVVLGNSIDYVADFSTLIFESVPFSFGTNKLIDTDQLSIDPTTGNEVTSNIAVTLNPGDQFFVVAQLDVRGRNGTADSFNTLNLQFLNATTGTQITSGLTAASAISPVPLPAAAWMLLVAMGGLFGMRRMQRA